MMRKLSDNEVPLVQGGALEEEAVGFGEGRRWTSRRRSTEEDTFVDRDDRLTPLDKLPSFRN
jgi:hypothetical protein